MEHKKGFTKIYTDFQATHTRCLKYPNFSAWERKYKGITLDDIDVDLRENLLHPSNCNKSDENSTNSDNEISP